MVADWYWYDIGKVLAWYRYGNGMALAWYRYGTGMVLALVLHCCGFIWNPNGFAVTSRLELDSALTELGFGQNWIRIE